MNYQAIIFTDLVIQDVNVRSLGAYQIAGVLRLHGYRTIVIDRLSFWMFDFVNLIRLIKGIASNKIYIIGFSGTFFLGNTNKYTGFFYHKNRKLIVLLKMLRYLSPEAKILFGSQKQKQLAPFKNYVDAAFAGYSEQKLLDYLNIPKQFLFDTVLEKFQDEDIILPHQPLPISIGRGCMFSCSFCSFPLRSRTKSDPNYHKSKAKIVAELKTNFDKFGTLRYAVVDDTFNETTQKIELFLDAINDTKLSIEYVAYLRIELLNKYPEQITLLHNSGLKSAFFGIESLNHQAAKSVGKGLHPDIIKNTLCQIKEQWKNNVSIFGSFIAGLPYENHETINEWMSWVFANSHLINNYKIFPLILEKNNTAGSDFEKNSAKWGYSFSNNTWLNNVGYSLNDAQTTASFWNLKNKNSNRSTPAGWEILALWANNLPVGKIKCITYKLLEKENQKVQHRLSIEYKDTLFRILNIP